MAINAIRLRTPDQPDGQGRYRYLQAVNGGGGGLFAVRVASPTQWETFLFEPPTAWPLSSGNQLSMNLCNSNWDASGMLVRVDHGVHVFPRASRKDPPLVTYEIGGLGQAVWVTAGFPAGYPAYPGDDPMERIFDIIKPAGGGINSLSLVGFSSSRLLSQMSLGLRVFLFGNRRPGWPRFRHEATQDQSIPSDQPPDDGDDATSKTTQHTWARTLRGGATGHMRLGQGLQTADGQGRINLASHADRP